jgi:putative flippase GtrA
MLAIKYLIFALISGVINLTSQWLSFVVYHGEGALYGAILVGTLAGLVAKYIFDKKYIFYHRSQSTVEHSKTFVLYSLMGIFTTVIFWGTEIAFDILFATEQAKYIGAACGLAIGYIIKYQLDKKYVFVQSKAISS